jgi:hypothetical protein
MDLLKKHYEKILLGVVLLGLAIAVASLPFKITSDRQSLEDKQNELVHPKVNPLTNLDLSVPEQTIKRAAAPAVIDLAAPNKLFNPMPWQQMPDNRLILGTKTGPIAAVVTNITPLYLRLTLDSITVSDTGARYVIGVTREAAPVQRDRNKKQFYCTLNTKNEVFDLVAVNGAPENPTNLVVILKDSGDRATITRDKAFQRVDGRMADIAYEPERKSWRDRRVGAWLNFNGEDYNIVAINENEVVLLAKSNQKKWTIPFNPSLTPNAGT